MNDGPPNSPKLEDYIRTYNLKVGAELGVNQATLSSYLLKTFPGLVLICVDAWADPDNNLIDAMNSQYDHGKCEEISRAKLEPFKDRARIVKSYTHLAAQLFKDQFFDFIYIDSSHKGNCLKTEIVHWYDKVKDGGLICGHDYVDDWGGDYKIEISKLFGNHLDTTEQSDTSWFCWKKDINQDYFNQIKKELSPSS